MRKKPRYPGVNGYIGVLPGHAPLIQELGAGEISYRSNGRLHRFSMAWGFAEILPEKVTVLAETVERADEIDVSRAQQSLHKAEDLLKSAQPKNNSRSRHRRSGVRKHGSKWRSARKSN
jgi:F-type H+-transporting ATPase subunit epsilon